MEKKMETTIIWGYVGVYYRVYIDRNTSGRPEPKSDHQDVGGVCHSRIATSG